jgi:NADPH:quinone reductase-like Zn-dependent oxidoreductase
MRTITIAKHGGPEVLEIRHVDDPSPAPGEVRVRVRAAGLNFAEVMARKGLYPDAPKGPLVAGYEAAGEVDAVGEGVSGVKLGDRVAALTRFGGHAEAVCVPEAQVFAMPDAMSFEEGAALPVNYLTAHHMLFQVFRVRAGDRVLVHMAAGGVGTAVLQLCRTVPGLTVFGTASAGKHDYVRSLGCDHAIDYRTLDYADEVRRLTNGEGVDLVLDALGGRDWKKGYRLLRPGGLLIAFGWANMSSGERRNPLHVVKELTGLPVFTPTTVMSDNRGIAGVNMGHMWDFIPTLRWQGERLMTLYTEGAIRPHIDSALPFTEAAEAHRRLESGKTVGKVVLVP